MIGELGNIYIACYFGEEVLTLVRIIYKQIELVVIE